MVEPDVQRELACLREELACMRLQIGVSSRHRREAFRVADGGSSLPSPIRISTTVEEQQQSCLQEWMRLASRKFHLVLSSGTSESERSAEALPWLVEAESSGRQFTWQETQEFERFAQLGGEEWEEEEDDDDEEEEDDACDSKVKAEFLRLAKARRRPLWLEVLRLSSLKKGIDFLGMADEPLRAAEAEKLRQEKLREAQRLRDEGDQRGAGEQEARARIIDFDAKMGGVYYNSVFTLIDLATFDHMEECKSSVLVVSQLMPLRISICCCLLVLLHPIHTHTHTHTHIIVAPVAPVRFADRVFPDMMAPAVHISLNILSVEIACSDIGFPIQVYGTVVVRDYIDYKRVYLFRRGSDHPQLINSEKEALILTGPKRALTLTYSPDFFETDLWVKDGQGHCRQFSKGIVWIPGTDAEIWDKGEAERLSLGTRLSTVDVTYDVILRALEASIAVEVIQGEFYGSMDAHTTTSSRRILLYDSSKVAGGSCHGVIQLLRTSVSVCVEDKLIILAKNDAGACRDVQFTPRCRGRDESVLITFDDATTLCVKVVWSMIDICP